MAIYAIRYNYSPDTDLIARTRPVHREYLRSLFDQGALLASGPLGSDGALLIVRADDATEALSLVNADPFNEVGVIVEREALEWTQVYGPWA